MSSSPEAIPARPVCHAKTVASEPDSTHIQRASAMRLEPMPALNSNASRPMPRADTGSALLNWLSDTSTFLLHLERRFDPFFRPAFDALLRDRLTALTTDLINMQRPNEGLKIAILGVAEIKKKDSDSTASITPARRLPARRDGRFTCRRRRRVRHPLATANRSAPYADRKQRRALAREAFTSRIGGHVASPAAEIRLYGADRVRKTAFIQSVALHSRASATGKSKPCSAPDVRGAFEAPAHDECRATLRTDWRRGIRLGGFA
jgi:hypothetical protein